MLKDDTLVLLVLLPMFFVSLVEWKLDAAKLGLDQERDFMSCQGNVDFDGEPDLNVLVNMLVKRLFHAFEPDVVEFFRLGKHRKL